MHEESILYDQYSGANFLQKFLCIALLKKYRSSQQQGRLQNEDGIITSFVF